ncbi:GreA/GreB family elongation factor [Streptomyces sp. TP-A0874]|uniref:GreA/GreB family elongation factor n=1 Tax=Streptomyces sp. TP-A0874 TaxID=549819 RepID=UPI000853B83E|nr:GreA/GreB family elongation factor [Streptomyces sp. TP-A0874]
MATPERSRATGPQHAPLTETARRRLEEERELLHEQRRDLADSMGAVGADPLGDTGDQSQAIENRDRLRRFDDRIAEIDDRLANSGTAEPPTSDFVAVGSTVTLEYEDGGRATLRIGDIAEESGNGDVITPGSPLGRALIGRATGDSITYDAPEGKLRATLVELSAGS